MIKFYSLLLLFAIYSCNKKPVPATANNDMYAVLNTNLYNFNNPVQLIGSNAFYVFSAGSRDMNSWNLDIAREFNCLLKFFKTKTQRFEK